MATYEEQSDIVVDQIGDYKALAEAYLADFKVILDTVNPILAQGVTDLLANSISINVTGVDTTYVPPTAAPPTIPDADDVSIGDTEWDQIYQRSADKLARIGVTREDEASNRSAAWGHDQMDETAAALLAGAEDETDARTSEVALVSATEQAKGAREDIVVLLAQQLEKYKSQWTTQVDSENARRGFEALELQKQVDPEKIRADYDLGKTKLSLDFQSSDLLDFLKIYNALINALLTASDVNLSSTVGISLSGDA